MARYRRTLEDSLRDMSNATRSTSTVALGVPELQPVGAEYLLPGAVTTEALADNAVQLANLDTALQNNLDQLDTNLAQAMQDISAATGDMAGMDARLDAAAADIAAANTRLDSEILPAISDAAASPVTDDRLVAGSLTTWPFQDGAVPAGGLAPGSVGSSEIADFAIAVTKLKSTRHHLY